MLSNFEHFLSSEDISKIDFFKKFFEEYNQNVKQFGSKSEQTFSQKRLANFSSAKFMIGDLRFNTVSVVHAKLDEDREQWMNKKYKLACLSCSTTQIFDQFKFSKNS